MYDGGDEKPKKRDTEAEDRESAARFNATEVGIDPERGFNDDRGCTDIFCFLIFSAFLGSMLFLTFYANKHGNPDLMFASTDGDSYMCGFDRENVRLPREHADFDKTKLFISDLTFVNGKGLSGIKRIFKSSVCVKECPKSDSSVTEYRTTSEVTGKALEGYKTHTLLNLCAPNAEDLKSEFADGWKMVKASILASPAGSFLNDMYLSSRAMYTSFVTAPVYCFFFIFLMSKWSEPISWFIIIAVQLGLIGATGGLFYMRGEEAKLRQKNIDSGIGVDK